MTKNPLLNALSAAIYITLLAIVMTWGTKGMQNQSDTFMAPILAVSVFTLSTAVMGYIFGFYPITMYLDGKKKEAVKLALYTIFYFGIITITLMILVFGRIIK